MCLAAVFTAEGNVRQKNEITVKSGVLQLKDGLNQNMVYTGPRIEFGYARNWSAGDWRLRYHPVIGAGVPFNRGMLAANIRFTPLDLSGIRTVFQIGRHTMSAGLNIVMDYGYTAYTEQHSAQLFYHGEIGSGLSLEYEYRWQQREMTLGVQNSVAGFVSRIREVSPYFYSFKFTDFFIKPHRGMRFGSFDKYNHTRVIVEYTPDRSKRHSFAAGVEWVDLRIGARFQSLTYSLQWKRSF